MEKVKQNEKAEEFLSVEHYKKFKAFVTKMLTVLGERIYLRSNIFNKELENIF